MSKTIDYARIQNEGTIMSKEQIINSYIEWHKSSKIPSQVIKQDIHLLQTILKDDTAYACKGVGEVGKESIRVLVNGKRVHNGIVFVSGAYGSRPYRFMHADKFGVSLDRRFVVARIGDWGHAHEAVQKVLKSKN